MVWWGQVVTDNPPLETWKPQILSGASCSKETVFPIHKTFLDHLKVTSLGHFKT